MFALGAVVPIDLRALAASTLGAYAVIAVIEGVITALIVRALLGVRPDLVRVAEPLRRRRQAPALAPRGEVARPPSAVASSAGRPEGETPWA
jgi:cobalt/nickel transport system permease protein